MSCADVSLKSISWKVSIEHLCPAAINGYRIYSLIFVYQRRSSTCMFVDDLLWKHSLLGVLLSSRNKPFSILSNPSLNKNPLKMKSSISKDFDHSENERIVPWHIVSISSLLLDFNTGGMEVSTMARDRAILVESPLRLCALHHPSLSLSLRLGLDWSRYDSRLSGRASRLPDRVHGIFHHQYTWPCSIGDSNMGMFCIETNCDKRNYYKH